MTLQECVSFLTDGKYLVQHKGRYILTSKFNEEMTGEDTGIVIDEPIIREQPTKKKDKTDWIAKFQAFIIAAKIPKKSFSSNGIAYDINHATKPGREAFKKALREITEEELLARTIHYYRDSRSFRVTIESFLVKEMWRSIDSSTKETSNGSDGIKFG